MLGEYPSIWTALFFGACFVLALVPWAFIFTRAYDDGLCGRIALAVIALVASIVVLVTAFGPNYYDAGWETAVLATAFAAFLVWHFVRFYR